MYSLFSGTGYTVGQGILTDPNWLYCKEGLHRNLSAVIKFNRTHPKAVLSNHLIVRILQSIPTPQAQNLERYYNNIDSYALTLAMGFGLSSSIFKGKMFDGIFYGKGNDEIIIANNESFNPFEADSDWENQSPITVLRHPRSDLSLNLLDGTEINGEKGLAIIAVNIPMLAIMYRAFRNNEMRLRDNIIDEDTGIQYSDSQRSVMQFVHMYVLPNILPSHLDYAIFNRISNLELGAPLGELEERHSFYLTDYSPRINKVQKNILNFIHSVDRDFYGILETIPMISNKSAFDSLVLPDIAETRQVLPLLFLSRLNVLTFLYKIAKNGPGERNRSLLNLIKRTVNYYNYEAQLRQILPQDLLYDTNLEIMELK